MDASCLFRYFGEILKLALIKRRIVNITRKARIGQKKSFGPIKVVFPSLSFSLGFIRFKINSPLFGGFSLCPREKEIYVKNVAASKWESRTHVYTRAIVGPSIKDFTSGQLSKTAAVRTPLTATLCIAAFVAPPKSRTQALCSGLCRASIYCNADLRSEAAFLLPATAAAGLAQPSSFKFVPFTNALGARRRCLNYY